MTHSKTRKRLLTHPIQRKQALKLAPRFRKLIERKTGKENLSSKRVAKLIGQKIDFDDIVSRENYDILECYPAKNNDTSGRRIKITGIFKIDGNCKMFKGIEVLTGRKVIVKDYFNKKRGKDTSLEIDVYRKLNCPPPIIDPDYLLWGRPVLVMEVMEPLNAKRDDYREVGKAVIKQLQKLHKFCVHTDLKPDNIMRHPESGEYYLIDYGGISYVKNRDKNGKFFYNRRCFSPLWQSQSHIRHEKTPVYPKQDLLELGFAMKHLWNQNNGIYRNSMKLNRDKSDKYIRDTSKYRGTLRKYIKAVKKLPSTINLDRKYYNELINILDGKK